MTIERKVMDAKEIERRSESLPEIKDRTTIQKLPEIAEYVLKHKDTNIECITEKFNVDESLLVTLDFIIDMLKHNYGAPNTAEKARVKRDDVLKVSKALKGKNSSTSLKEQINEYMKKSHIEKKAPMKINKTVYSLYSGIAFIGLIAAGLGFISKNLYEKNKLLEEKLLNYRRKNAVQIDTASGAEAYAKMSDLKYAADTNSIDTAETKDTQKPLDDNRKAKSESKQKLNSAEAHERYKRLMREGKIDAAMGLEDAYGVVKLGKDDLRFIIEKYWERKSLYGALKNQDCSKENLERIGLHNSYIDYVHERWTEAKKD